MLRPVSRGVSLLLETFFFCELSFIWGKKRAAAWEAAPQIALRGCSKEAIGEVNT